MRKRVYRYVRYYLELPKHIAEPSLGIQLEARRLGDYIIISPPHGELFSTSEKIKRQNPLASKEAGRVHVGNPSNRNPKKGIS